MKCILKDRKGHTTIFLLIVFTSLVILLGCIIDVVRVYSSKNIINRSIEASADSALVNYSAYLKNEYGLFATSPYNSAALEDLVMYYLSSNLESSNSGVKLYDFRIENMQVIDVTDLTNINELERQILEHMKYRAPVSYISNIYEKINLFKKASKQTESFKLKIELDSLLKALDDVKRDIEEYVNGVINNGKAYVNGFFDRKRDETKDDLINSILNRRELIEELKTIREDVNELNNQLISLNISISQTELELQLLILKIEEEQEEPENQEEQEEPEIQEAQEGPEEQEEPEELYIKEERDYETELEVLEIKLDELNNIYSNITDQLNDLNDKEENLENSIAYTENQIEEYWDKLYNYNTLIFIKPNQDALEKVLEMKHVFDDIKQRQKEIDEKVNMFSEEDEMESDFANSMNDEMDISRQLLGDSQGSIEETFTNNITYLQALISKMDMVKQSVLTNYDIEGDRETIEKKLSTSDGSYSSVTFNHEKIGKGDSSMDKRPSIIEMVKNLLKSPLGILTGNIDKHIDFTNLPSQNMSGDNGNSDDTGTQDESMNDIENNIEFNEKYKGKFSINSLSSFSKMGELISDSFLDMRNDLYVNEYIILNFGNSSKRVNDNSYMKSEVEYILNGMPSEKLNAALTQGKLLLSRFALNTLHVYTDSSKRTQASVLASAIAGWWTGGAGIPIISNLIMCSWSMGESVLDINDLLKGNEVAFIKGTKDWKLDIGLLSGGSLTNGVNVKLSYEDYLRLFLLGTDKDTKLIRAADIVQLNLNEEGYEGLLEDYKSVICIKVDVSVNYIFPAMHLVPSKNSGRYYYSKTYFAGY